MSNTITFDDVERIAAAHYAADAAKHTPKAAAIRAVYTLVSLLPDLDAADRCVVRRLIYDEITTYHG